MVETRAEARLSAGETPRRARPALLLYLSRDRERRDAAVMPTLARIAAGAGLLFDAYREGRHAGTHHGGGDPRLQERAALLGGTLIGGRHIESAASVCARYDVMLAILGDSLMSAHLLAHGARTIAHAETPGALYDEVLSALGAERPRGLTLICPPREDSLEGLEFYAASLAWELGGVVFLDDDTEWEKWIQPGETVRSILAPAGGSPGNVADTTAGAGVRTERVAALEPGDDYATATVRLLRSRKGRPTALLLADPPLTAHSVPLTLRSGWAPVFGVPLSAATDRLDAELAPGSIAYGRVFEDGDFFRLSERGVSLQILDPFRPPFPVAGGPPAAWPQEYGSGPRATAGAELTISPFPDEPDDAQLETLARGGAVLVTLAFWAGAVREIETLYALFDLVASTGLKCGVALTDGSYEMGGGLVSLLAAPVEGGGVYPLVEPLLGCTGDGVAAEYLMEPEILRKHLSASLERISTLAPARFVPRGWWVTMDARLEDRPAGRRPGRLSLRGGDAEPGEPRVKFRYHKKPKHRLSGSVSPGASPSPGGTPGTGGSLRSRVEGALRQRGLEKYFEPYRPFEFMEPGPVPPGLWEAAAASGLGYVFTKSCFGGPPTVSSLGDGFVAFNHTAGRWDGWTPFETVNRVSDLETAEKTLIATGRPGWLATSVDTCLWAFSGELWGRAAELRRVARFCAGGGRSGRLVPALPRTVARYAMTCARLGLVRSTIKDDGE